MEQEKVSTAEELDALLDKVREAQRIFSTYSQEQVDKIFKHCSVVANELRIKLAQEAVEETGMGIVEDKVIKNHYAAEYIYNKYKDTQTVGVLEENIDMGYKRVAEPIGVVACVIPTTNPTSTAIFKALLCLKTRNGCIFSPHPRAKKCTIHAAKVILDAAVEAGAPENIIGWITDPSMQLSSQIMKEADCILATGGPGMVTAAYSSGKPAIGVGPGNTPAIIDSSADIQLAVYSIIQSKTFDNGMICASEQSCIVDKSIYEKVKKEFQFRGCYFLKGDELDKVRKTIIINGNLNAKIVGQSAYNIAKLSGVEVPTTTKILIGEVKDTSTAEEFAREKLSPVLAMYKAEDFDDAISKAVELVRHGGYGHTSSVYLDEVTSQDKLTKFYKAMKTCRILVNTPSAQGGIGDIYNFLITPSLTLGCGSWGGNSVSENVGVKQLLNVKTVAIRRENMLWFRVPPKVFFKPGCLRNALTELKEVYNKKKVFIVTDKFLYESGFTRRITDVLDMLGIEHTVYSDVAPDPTLACARDGARLMQSFKPDCIVAIGGGSPMDAAKIMWVLYEHPDADFQAMAMTFMDIRKRVYTFPQMGEKAMMVCIPTTAGTGSEVTPFAVITDESNGCKYPLADYQLLPHMAIVDSDLMLNIPKGLTRASGIDSLVHSIEAIASIMSTPFSDAMANEAVKLIFEYLPRCYTNGSADPKAREMQAYASTLAGISFANAFLGIAHSLGHKLGAYFHLPHGVCVSLMLIPVMKFNASETPTKMGTFPQYDHPVSLQRYAHLAETLGIEGKTDKEKFDKLIEKIYKLQDEVEMFHTIKDYGVKEEDFLRVLDQMSEDAFNDQCTGANPRYPLISEMKELYLEAYYGEKK